MKSSSDATNKERSADVRDLKKAFKEMPLETAFLMILDFGETNVMLNILLYNSIFADCFAA